MGVYRDKLATLDKNMRLNINNDGRFIIIIIDEIKIEYLYRKNANQHEGRWEGDGIWR